MIDLMAIAAIDRETEVTYIRRERDWAARAAAEGRFVDAARLLPVLPADDRRRRRQRRQRPRPRARRARPRRRRRHAAHHE